jgi:hypothetical protein
MSTSAVARARYENCKLHQLGRINVALLEQYKLLGPVYSLGKIMAMRRKRQALRTAILQLLEHNLDYRQDEEPPRRLATSPAFRLWLKDLLRSRDHERSAGVPNEADAALLSAYLDFFNGDVTQDDLMHYCNINPQTGKRCCANRVIAVKRGGKLATNMFCSKGFLEFKSGRWLQQLPSMCRWGRICLVHNIGAQAFNRMSFKEENLAALPEDAPQLIDEVLKLQRDIGVRLAAGRKFFKDEWTRFTLALILHVVILLEEVVRVFFYCNRVYNGPASEQVRKRRRRMREKRQPSASAADPPGAAPEPKMSKMSDIVGVCRKMVRKLWSLFLQPVALLAVPALLKHG